MNALGAIYALLWIMVLVGPAEAADCSAGGQLDAAEKNREIANLIDRIELEYFRAKGLSEEAVELRAELREKQDELKVWLAECYPPGPRRRK